MDVRLVFDAKQRITQYLERRVHKRHFRLVKPKNEIVPILDLPIPYGAVVEDLHDYVSVEGARGPDVRRKVQYAGKAYWLPEAMHLEVPADPEGRGGPGQYGTMEIRYLEPVGENARSTPELEVIHNCNGRLKCGACPPDSPATTSTVVPPVPHP